VAGLAQVMEQAWSSMEEVCLQLAPDDWARPTDCPGWSVKDQLAHICAVESVLLGRPPAPEVPIDAPYVRNEMGQVHERELICRRGRSPEQLLDEYRDVTAERGKVLASWTEEEWNEEAQGVLGVAQRTRIIGIRVVDVFTLEQDIRVATGKPGHMAGDVARFVFGQMAATMPFVLGKRAQASEGESVVFAVGPPGETFAVGTSGGRGARLEQLPADPTVRMDMDGEVFLRLTAGRWSPKRVVEERRLRVSGDKDLADRILAGMIITP